MKIIGKNFDKKRVKKIVYTAVFGVFIFWFIFRFIMILIESQMVVFNPERENKEAGLIVDTIVAEHRDGVINIPLAIKNNRAYVSANKRTKLHVGQKVSDGKIVYTANSLDLDSGMYVIKTVGVADGIKNVAMDMNCIFVPIYAVHDNTVFVMDLGHAVTRSVVLGEQDSANACVLSGINDGDIVILSKVEAGQKVRQVNNKGW